MQHEYAAIQASQSHQQETDVGEVGRTAGWGGGRGVRSAAETKTKVRSPAWAERKLQDLKFS